MKEWADEDSLSVRVCEDESKVKEVHTWEGEKGLIVSQGVRGWRREGVSETMEEWLGEGVRGWVLPWALSGWLEVPSELLNLLSHSGTIYIYNFSPLKFTNWRLEYLDILQLGVIKCVKSDLNKGNTDVWNMATKNIKCKILESRMKIPRQWLLWIWLMF